MIDFKFIFQSLTVSGAVVACVGLAAYAKIAYKDANNDFYLVSSVSSSEQDRPSNDLWRTTTQQTMTEQEKKNYFCKTVISSSVEKVDDNCKIYSLIFDTKNKSLDFSNIQAFVNAKENQEENFVSPHIKKTQVKSEIKSNKFFLLKASKHLFLSLDNYLTTVINLVSKKYVKKTYAKFNILAKISTTEEIKGANLLIVKTTQLNLSPISNNETNETGTTYKCHTDFEPQLSACSIAEFKNNVNSDKKTFHFRSAFIAAPHTSSFSLDANEFFLINWPPLTKHDYKNLSGKKIIFVLTQNKKDTTRELNIEYAIFALPITNTANNSKPTFNEAIILK